MSGATVQSLLADAVRVLAGVETARLDAEVLLQNVLGAERSWLYAHAGDAVDAGRASDFQRLVANRSLGFPVAYLTGSREFWSLSLRVDRHTLIPRPETELLVETGLDLAAGRRNPRVLDLGTGSGAVALAFAKERPDADIIATDLSREALAVARMNAAMHAITKVDLRHSDWYAALHGERFDLILCNPPYVDGDDPALVEGELRFEPRLALDGGPAGLRALTTVIAGARGHVVAGGFLAVEHGRDQGVDVLAAFRNAGFTGISTVRDAAGLERVSFGIWP
jgi:release factor glutamine methyltransferase